MSSHATTSEVPILTVDGIRSLATEVANGSRDPFEAGRLIMAEQIETDHGPQPRYLAVGGVAVKTGLEPTVLMSVDTMDESSHAWRLWSPTARGGIRHGLRAASDIKLAGWSTIGGVNIPAERLLVGGLGSKDTHDRGVAGWKRALPSTRMRVLGPIYSHMLEHPNEVTGSVAFIENDGSFEPMATAAPGESEPDGQYVSFARMGHVVLANMPIRSGQLTPMPNIHTFTYPDA